MMLLSFLSNFFNVLHHFNLAFLDSENFFFLMYFNQAIDIAAVTTFLLEALPPIKSSSPEIRQSMHFS